jgi:hypothetical protein
MLNSFSKMTICLSLNNYLLTMTGLDTSILQYLIAKEELQFISKVEINLLFADNDALAVEVSTKLLLNAL